MCENSSPKFFLPNFDWKVFFSVRNRPPKNFPRPVYAYNTCVQIIFCVPLPLRTSSWAFCVQIIQRFKMFSKFSRCHEFFTTFHCFPVAFEYHLRHPTHHWVTSRPQNIYWATTSRLQWPYMFGFYPKNLFKRILYLPSKLVVQNPRRSAELKQNKRTISILQTVEKCFVRHQIVTWDFCEWRDTRSKLPHCFKISSSKLHDISVDDKNFGKLKVC